MNLVERFAVIGLGYVGLPVAVGFARAHGNTLGFDVDPKRVDELRDGLDRTGEVATDALQASGLRVTCDPNDLNDRTFFIVAVPTPVDASNRPDFGPLLRACETVGKALSRGAVVVFESTVYPGATEQVCGPALARASGLQQGADFTLGYSPERINPGDQLHRLETIVKVVSGEDAPTLSRVSAAYARVVEAGVYEAQSIQVAEAAKVIENTQRDLNVAFMNELALICDRLGIRTADVLTAARTKWNFLPFTPGLVGGHCIGVDPYYLTAKAEELGYQPQVILAGRRINDGMGRFIAQKTLRLLAERFNGSGERRVAVLGLTFKENVPDLRNSRVPDIVAELRQFGANVQVCDPMVDPADARHEYGIDLVDLGEIESADAVVLAVPHRELLGVDLCSLVRPGGLVVDVKSALDPKALCPKLGYWSL